MVQVVDEVSVLDMLVKSRAPSHEFIAFMLEVIDLDEYVNMLGTVPLHELPSYEIVTAVFQMSSTAKRLNKMLVDMYRAPSNNFVPDACINGIAMAKDAAWDSLNKFKDGQRAFV